MEWQDQGVLLNIRRHGESAAIIAVFSEHHGLHSGLVRGGGSRKMAAMLQPGAQLSLTWRARLEDQLGSFSVELIKSRSATFLSERLKLYAFNALSAMLAAYLPEREKNEALFQSFMDLLLRMEVDNKWQHKYCLFEMEFLSTLGYGIDINTCAVTGQHTDLKYVSPKSGRAVCLEAAKGFEPKLLSLPAFLQGAEMQDISNVEFQHAIHLTGYFFEKWVPLPKPGLPSARLRLDAIVQR